MSVQIRRIKTGYNAERGHWAECEDPVAIANHCGGAVDAAKVCASFVAGKLRMHFVQIEHLPPGDDHIARFDSDPFTDEA